MVEDAPLKVSPVVVAKFQGVDILDVVTVEVPSVNVAVPVPLYTKLPVVILKLPVLKLPFVNVIGVVVLVVNELPKVQPPPTPLNVIFATVLLLVVIVLPVVVAVNIICKEAAPADPLEGSERLPVQVLTSPEKNSDCVAVTVKSWQVAEAAVIVTVPVPEEVSKITLSVDVGTPALPAPPELEAQLVVVEAFQVPDPPTQ